LKALVVVVVTVLTIGCGGEPPTMISGDFAFLNVDVLPMDGTGDHLLERQVVMIENGQVSLIGAADEFSVAEDVTSIDAEDYFLMPGLTEMHGHLPNPRMSDEDVRNLLFLYVANGVTTVRGMQGDPSQFALRSAIERGRLLGPNLYLASVSMNGTSVTTPEEASQRVREYKVDGYDLIKTHEGMSLDAFNALAETALEVDIPFGGHVSDYVGLRHALASGQMSIDHLDNYVEALAPSDDRADEDRGLRGVGALVESVDENRIPELVRATVESGAWVVPTMVLWETAFFNERGSAEVLSERPEVRYMPPEMVDRWREAVDTRLESTEIETNRRIAALRRNILSALHEGGANIALGTDSPQIFSVPGFAMYHEMVLYTEAGMTPYEVLEIGTRRPAEYFDATDRFGTVAVGRRADLILLEANPADDIGEIRNRVGVMVNGRWIPADEIERRLREIALFYGNEP